MVTVSMEGVKDAVDAVKEIVVPAQKKQAERKSKLDNELRQAEIQRLNAQTLTEKVKTEREKASITIDKAQAELIMAQAKKTESEAQLILAQAEKTLVEADKERESLHLERINLAVEIIEKFNPNVSGSLKINFILRLLPEIEKLMNGGVELEE